MKNLKLILSGILLLIVFGWYACRKEHLTSYAEVAFSGRVIDENDAPVIGAKVHWGDKVILTDGNGAFWTEPLRVPDDNAILKVTSNFYFDFTRAFFVEDKSVQTVTIQLLRKEHVGWVEPEGNVVNIPGGATLKFPPGAINTTENVYILARYLNPTDEKLALFMPGDLRGISAGGEDQVLTTYGMIAVELKTYLGDVQIAEGKEVEISVPIANTQAGNAPAEIPLWYFDAEKGRWMEEGKAQKVGDRYVGTVKHFSVWNFDIGLPAVDLSGQVCIGDEQHPLNQAQVTVSTIPVGFSGCAFTDAYGRFKGSVPRDMEMQLTIRAHDQCGNAVLYTQTIGPFSDHTVLPPIVLTDVPFAHLSGTLTDCSGQPVTYGYLYIPPSSIAFTDQNGRFSLNYLNCNAVATVITHGFDLNNRLESAPHTVTLPGSEGTVDIGNVAICLGLDEFIHYTLDNQVYTVVNPAGSVLDSVAGKFVSLSNQAGVAPNVKLKFYADQPGVYSFHTFQANNIYVWGYSLTNLTTTLSAFPAVLDDYFIGTFGGNYTDDQGTSHAIWGSYRVKRE